MREKMMYKEFKQEIRGLKDPGNVLIVVYILFILALLLFAGLQSAKADFQKAKEGTFSIVHQETVTPSVRHPDFSKNHFFKSR
jgi:hypothetical protein